MLLWFVLLWIYKKFISVQWVYKKRAFSVSVTGKCRWLYFYRLFTFFLTNFSKWSQHYLFHGKWVAGSVCLNTEDTGQELETQAIPLHVVYSSTSPAPFLHSHLPFYFPSCLISFLSYLIITQDHYRRSCWSMTVAKSLPSSPERN